MAREGGRGSNREDKRDVCWHNAALFLLPAVLVSFGTCGVQIEPGLRTVCGTLELGRMPHRRQ